MLLSDTGFSFINTFEYASLAIPNEKALPCGAFLSKSD
jgi:hypothetical protein